MFGDPKRPADHPRLRAPVSQRDILDRSRRHTGLALRALQRISLDAASELVIAGGGTRNETRIGQPLMDDHSRHRVGKRDVAADVESEPNVSPLRRTGAAWIDSNELGAVANAAQEVVKEDR